MSAQSSKRKSKESDSECANKKIVCEYCSSLDDTHDELIVLTDHRLLSLYDSINGDINGDRSADERPQHRVSQFVVHDSSGALCGIDCGKIENGCDVYLCGLVTPVVDEGVHELTRDRDDDCRGVAAKMIGPLVEWWFAGFDGGDQVIIGVESLYASYVISRPHPLYSHIFSLSVQKAFLTKIIIETVSQNPDCSFDDLLDSLKERDEEFSEELLLRFASFIVEQIKSYDSAGEDDELTLTNTQSIQDLIYFAGLSNNSSETSTKSVCHMRPIARIDARRAANSDSLTASTPLVKKFFDSLFNGVIEKIYNRDNKCKSAPQNITQKNKLYSRVNCDNDQIKISWIGDAIYEDKFARRSYYKFVKVNDQMFSLGDFVLVRNEDESSELGRIMFMFNNSNRQKFCHIHLFSFGSDTILGETSPNGHVFMSTKCNDINICNIMSKKEVYLTSNIDEANETNSHDLICHKIYYRESGRFEDLPQIAFDVNELKCVSCAINDKNETLKMPILGEQIFTNELCAASKYKSLSFNNVNYFVDDCVFVLNSAIELPYFNYEQLIENEELDYDETIYPEKYRKKFTDFVKGSNNDLPQTYIIGCIKEIIKQSDDLLETTRVIINIFYRPHNVYSNYDDYSACDINLLFWSTQEYSVSYEALRGVCTVIYRLSSDSTIDDYYIEPNKFYFNRAYDSAQKIFTEIPQEICDKFLPNIETETNADIRKMQILDIFSGCGGLSFGFESMSLSSKLWAIEKDRSAANSFKANFPSAIMFEEDANHFLDLLIRNVIVDKHGRYLPQRGDIDVILGGPPCQGFSGMNRFSSRQYSLFKNSLVVSFLSFVDYYRPKYLLFENVRNFALFKHSMILKLTLSCLIRMGYQCQFAILQSGSYGIPQTRRRTVIIGAASGHKLPNFPQPTHVFSLRQCQLSVNIDDRKYNSTVNTCAQFRAILVYDAISDLPKLLEDYALESSRDYKSNSRSHYQKVLRKNCDSDRKLSDHTCKELGDLCRARIEHIPRKMGADWRDLPNIRHPLSDGTITKKLLYSYDDLKNGKSSAGALRGVCLCASGKSCNPTDTRQENTLIPWCLVHTANRQYQWSGLYGRLSLMGYFPTTVTNPEPISKQGRVLHPTQDRIISIRESARSQGFPDHFRFSGSVIDKYRQIGNAVPIPLAIAIAREFQKSF